MQNLLHCSVKPLSVAYALKVALATLLAWPCLQKLGIAQPVWAIVTIAAVSDPDWSAARRLALIRITNTLTGCLVAILTVFLFGATLASMAGALAISVLLVTSIEHYPANWRLAPITVAIVMGQAVGGPSLEALHLAWLRTSEVISGAIAALLMAWLFSALIQQFNRHASDRKHEGQNDDE
jgi:uncharacterized membrane protein YccC